jgi:hypothetical protein
MGTSLTVTDAVRRIKAHIQQGDKAKDKANQHYHSAGILLKELRENCSNKSAWEALIRSKCGIGPSRAYELIQIADGRKTTEALRLGTAARVRKHAEKRRSRPLANGQNKAAEFAANDDPQPKKRPPRKQATIELTVESDLEVSEYRQAFLLRAADALAFAVYSGPIDKEVIAAAERVAAKWKAFAQTLEPEPKSEPTPFCSFCGDIIRKEDEKASPPAAPEAKVLSDEEVRLVLAAMSDATRRRAFAILKEEFGDAAAPGSRRRATPTQKRQREGQIKAYRCDKTIDAFDEFEGTKIEPSRRMQQESAHGDISPLAPATAADDYPDLPDSLRRAPKVVAA